VRRWKTLYLHTEKYNLRSREEEGQVQPDGVNEEWALLLEEGFNGTTDILKSIDATV
jgi:hypothetical protein